MIRVGYFLAPEDGSKYVKIHKYLSDIPPNSEFYICFYTPSGSDRVALSEVTGVTHMGPRLDTRMFVYHGSSVVVEQPKLLSRRYAADFGEGFYCTKLRHQAVKWARRKKPSIVSKYLLELPSSLNILKFDETTRDWADFVADCRNDVQYSYDAVIGPVADDQVYAHVNDYVSNKITYEEFRKYTDFTYPTHQVALCTERAIKCLTFISAEECTYGKRG